MECVDFIIHSVNDILQKEFNRSLSDENIHILDPFTGTGTFITRLLQSGLISKEDLLRKYQNEIHANEIVLLAYYIAAVNIENAFHDAYWGSGFGVKGMVNSNLNIETNENTIIQRTDSLAGSNESGRNDLSNNQKIPKGRTIWTDEPNSESGSIDTSEYSRGLRTEFEKGIPPIFNDSQRIDDGIRNTHLDSTKNSIHQSDRNRETNKSNTNSGQNIDGASQIANPNSLNPIPQTLNSEP